MPNSAAPNKNLRIIWEKIFCVTPYSLWLTKNTTTDIIINKSEGFILRSNYTKLI